MISDVSVVWRSYGLFSMFFFFFKQKTASEMPISDWSSDGCSSDLLKAKIFGSMSARAAQAIADEIEERGPIRLAEVIDAQKLIIATARRMADAGTIMLGGKGNDFV